MNRGKVFLLMKRLMIFTLCLWMITASVWAREEPLQLTVNGRITESSRLSENGLNTLNKLLSRLAIRQMAYPDGERAALIIDGKEMWSVHRSDEKDATLVVFSDTQGYRTAADAPDALMLLSGTGRAATIPLFAPDAYEKSAENVYAILQTAAEPVLQKSSTTVQNAAASPRYDRYTLTAEQMNALWPGMVAAIQPYFDRDGGEKEAWQAVADVRFTTDVRVKRLYDAAGQDLGVQMTGNGVVLGTERKISLLMGYTKGKGGGFTLSAKALKGKDSLKINASLKEKTKEDGTSYTLNCDFSHVMQGETESGAFSLSLMEKPGAWQGKAVWQQGNRSLTAEADIIIAPEHSQGNVTITAKEKKTVLFSAELQFFAESAPFQAAAQVPVRDLSGMTQQQAKTALYPEEMTLMRALIYLLGDLPEEERWQLTHELRTASWYTGEEVPLADENEQWIVEENAP